MNVEASNSNPEFLDAQDSLQVSRSSSTLPIKQKSLTRADILQGLQPLYDLHNNSIKELKEENQTLANTVKDMAKQCKTFNDEAIQTMRALTGELTKEIQGIKGRLDKVESDLTKPTDLVKIKTDVEAIQIRLQSESLKVQCSCQEKVELLTKQMKSLEADTSILKKDTTTFEERVKCFQK